MTVQHHGPRNTMVHDAAQRHRGERVVRVAVHALRGGGGEDEE